MMQVWRSGKGVGHINKFMLRRAQLVLGLVTTFGGSTMQYLSRPVTQPGNPSEGWCIEYWRWFRPTLGKE